MASHDSIGCNFRNYSARPSRPSRVVSTDATEAQTHDRDNLLDTPSVSTLYPFPRQLYLIRPVTLLLFNPVYSP